MARLLYIQASPRGSQSFSVQAAQALLEAYRAAHPQDVVETLDLFKADIPEFKAPEAKAKYAVLSGQAPAGEAERAWQPVIETINHFKAFDKFVIASAMWNFGIPYRLKQYIDVLVQPALTFSYSHEKGYAGLVVGKPLVLCLARGGAYGPGSGSEGLDFQRGYLETILGFIGFTGIQSVVVEPTLAQGPEAADKTLQAGKAKATEIGRTL